MPQGNAAELRIPVDGNGMGRRKKQNTAVAKKGRLRNNNEKRILDAAQDIFAKYGFRGASIDQIAEKAGLSQPNLLYYFNTKRALYVAVLDRILDNWLQPLSLLDPEGDPAAELGKYIAEKMEFSRTIPTASRVFANEILQGAPEIERYLRTDLRRIVDQKAGVIRQWIAAGKLADVDPYHLIFLIWAATQHYADFLPQVKAVMNIPRITREQFREIATSLTSIILNGVLPAPRK